MAEVILDYIDGISSLDSPEGLLAYMTRAIEGYGFNKFSYLGFNAKAVDKESSSRRGLINSTFVQSTFPTDWIEHYNRNELIYCDPMISGAKSNLLPFWWDGIKFLKKVPQSQQRALKEGREFGLKRGIVIPVHAPGGEFATVALATDGSEKELRDIWKYKRHELHLMGIHYHAAIWKNVFKRNIEPTPSLSPRELQCLEWAGRGKTVWEISRILGISEATARTHLRASFSKLGTSNKTHAVSKALIHGLIII